MLELTGGKISCCDGLPRRDFLRAGFLGLGGLSLSQLLQHRAQAAAARKSVRKTSVLFVEMAGGPSQHDTYDPKPLSPVEYRGLYGTVPTKLPGVLFSDRFPHQAGVMDKLAVIRSMHHDSGSHTTSSHLTQTGYYLRNRLNRDNEMPCTGSITSRLRGANQAGVPPFVSIIRTMRYGRAAYLGQGHNPFPVGGDPSKKNFRVENLSLARGLSTGRLENRQALLKSFDEQRRIIDTEGAAGSIDDFTAQAFEIVTGARARQAFDLQQETEKTRDRYGRTKLGQSFLLARRLIEAGVTFVTVRVGSWDHHWDLEARMAQMAPGFDLGLATFVTELHERALDGDVLVVAMGEFGRSPRMNDGRKKGTPGRDHWGSVMSVLLAGGGLQVGQVIGASDANGERPVASPYRPEDVLAMMYRHLDIDVQQTFPDHSGRPRYILESGDLIPELI
jgi:hypothetical protein